MTKEGYMTDREQFPVAVLGITVWAEERQTFGIPDTRATGEEKKKLCS
jgi:hypothetical protein